MGRICYTLLIFLCIVAFGGHYFERGLATTVTYDSKAIVIDGQRRVLLSGSLHYPRATPEVWPDLIRKCKEGGLDVIETYVFWNNHEPTKGHYYFEERFDLVRFVKTVQEAGLYVHLRIGPYACAEWNYGGFPMWLHFIPGMQFRTTNTPFQNEMEHFLRKIVTLMKDANLFASQGGPIILAQVENEYGNVEWAYGIGGELYVKWAASTAVALNTTVPWVMCSQEDAPDPIINTCNGFYCDTFTPNSPSKPKMWTENYPGWFLSFGYAIPYRPVEDIAFSVARFFETGGTFQNYYMYFGGTNFGRTAGGPLVATSYDYDAPINEYGFLREPKWSHLRDLHKAIKICEASLVNYDPTYISLGTNLEAHVYNGTSSCAAFLANIDHGLDANVSFDGNTYYLPSWSVSILPDCKSVIFNSAKVVSQKAFSGSLHKHEVSVEYHLISSAWEWYKEQVGPSVNNSFASPGLLEQINTTRDTSDYLWYGISINLDEELSLNEQQEVFLHVQSLGHASLLFVNKELTGFGYGNHDDASFSIDKKITLNHGNNTVELLSMMVGLQNYGPWFDIAGAGIFSVIMADFESAVVDLSAKEWTYQVGTEGEYLELDKMDHSNSSLWTSGNVLPINQSLIWYKTSFTAPEGNDPVALNLSSMGKGQAWVNGQSIGRYWPSYLSPSIGCSDKCDYRGPYNSNKCLKNCGEPAQTLYHVPRSWLYRGTNLLVLHEELGGDPSKITVWTRMGQELCARVSESDPPPVDSWKPSSAFESMSPQLKLHCEQGWHIASISFANFGTPQGECGKFTQGNCSIDVRAVLQETSFIAPEGNDPVALNLSSMGKGQAWVNGQNIGRYWPAYLSPSIGCSDKCDYRGPYNSNKCLKNCGEPAQTLYHVPRSWLYRGTNLLVLHEELGGDPSKITVWTRMGQELGARVSESDPPPVDSWKPSSAFESTSPQLKLHCEQGWHIASISFANFGTPQGECGKFTQGNCSIDVRAVLQEACLGRQSCSVTVSTNKFGDPCPGFLKSLAVEALCSK